MAKPYLHGTNGAIKVLDSTQSLYMADSGKLFICSQAGAYDITLPEVADAKGWVGTFLLGTAGSNDFDIIGGTTDVMVGVECGDTNVVIDAADKVTFVASNAVVGERVDIFCDGTNYYVTMFAVADNAASSAG
tara:strand:- start:1043 stop:1441 length:399 start_codon:yes stop_codon:yes gene_type:complete